MSQSWALSQEANKSSGICSVCHATRQLHNKDGTVHRHGSRKSPCLGSDKPPLDPTIQTSPITVQNPHTVNTSLSSTTSATTVVLPVAFSWSPPKWPIIKHIPKSARATCAIHLAGLLRNVGSHPEVEANWTSIFNWAGVILAVPKRGGRKNNLTSCIKTRLDSYLPTSLQTPELTYNAKRKDRSTSELQLAQAVSTKLEDGNLKAAIRLLISDDTQSTPSTEGLAKLQDKHPALTVDQSALPRPQPGESLTVTEVDVRRLGLSFPVGSSGGPDGLRPQHLKSLLQCQEAGPDLLSALTVFVNMVLDGRCPKDVAPVFFGGRLISLNKKSGGIRPIAIGLTLRRLVSKCANSVGVAQLAPYFTPRQLGVGTPGGCEAAIHSARRFLEDMPREKVLVKLDFTNAFNSLHRYDMLLAIKDRLPELYAYSFSAYAYPSTLFYGPFTLQSSEGPQQGDPLGPLLFSNALHPLLLSLESDVTLGYLDDVTLGGPEDKVAADVQRVADVGCAMGLQLNVSKCEVIADPGTTISDPFLQSFQRIIPNDAVLLGAPLFPGSTLDKHWVDRCDDMYRAVNRLSLIASQDALMLLRSSFSAPRVHHLLRCSPSVENSSLITFDNLLRSALERITNSSLSDTQWLQASLTIKEGGLGIRRVTSLALPAFLASAAGTSSLQTSILSNLSCQPDHFFVKYQSLWSTSYGPGPSGEPSGKQSLWDRPGLLQDRSQVEATLVDPRKKAIYLAAITQHSGDWLAAMPMASCGLRLEDEAVRVAVALRLGLSLCVPHTCKCGSEVDAWGLHAFVCKKAPGRIMRHHSLNDIVSRAFASAGIPASKEPSGLSRADGKRPDGLTLIPWKKGKPLTWDVTVATTLADSYIAASARSAGSAAEAAATRKLAKYTNLSMNYIFQPIAVENLGPLNESAADFMTDLGRRISVVSGEVREGAFLFQRVSVAMQRYNAILLHNSFISESDPNVC